MASTMIAAKTGPSGCARKLPAMFPSKNSMLDVVIPHNGHGTPVRNLDGQTGAEMLMKPGAEIESPALSFIGLIKKDAPMIYIRAIKIVTSAYCFRIES